MIEWYHQVVVLSGVFALVMSAKTPRAWIWVALIEAAYLLPTFYANMTKPEDGGWWPPISGISLICDAAVFVAIQNWHKEKWETYLAAVVFSATTLDLIQTSAVITGYPPPLPAFWYGSFMELLNLIAFSIITGVGFMDWIRDGIHLPSGRRGFVDRARDFAHSRSKQTQPLRKW